MKIYVLQYLSLPVFLVLVLMNPGGQNASTVQGNSCMHAKDCVVTSYMPVSVERAGEVLSTGIAVYEVYAMLGIIGILGFATGFLDARAPALRPMYFIMLGTVIALLPGVNSVPMGSLLIPYMPLELWVAILGGIVCFFGGAFRLVPIGFILGFCFSKLAFMTQGHLTYWLFVAGILIVIADHIISGLRAERMTQLEKNEFAQNSMLDSTHDLISERAPTRTGSSGLDFGEELHV